ncbi:NADH-quinone oxidoreductase subunit N [bacterium]|nr:MAG: NADH-quinone oxidoreductase subunit N [bacterium]
MFQFSLPSLDAYALAPMLLVAITGLLALMVELFSPKRNNNLIVAVSLGGLALALASLALGYGPNNYDTAAGTVVRDPVGGALQTILIVGSMLIVLVSEPYLREKRIPFAEFYPLVLWSTVGGMLMVGTNNLLLVFLGLEIMSIAIYVMAGMNRGEARSGESALKYFLLGSFASAFMLYGIALVYGATGSLSLDWIAMAWVRGGLSHTLLLIGLGMLLVGLSFKSSFAPFHQWTPDVYQGAPTNVTAFMATVSKVAALGALWRILGAYSYAYDAWAPAVGIIAALTMIVGNVAALAQTDVKRILGYSSVAQAGYVLVAIMAHAKRPDLIGPQAFVFFLLSYVLTTIGALAVVMLNARQGDEPTTLQDLHGLARRSPLAAGAMAFFALSLIGLPPLGGFFGKLYVLMDALKAGIPSLAIALALTSVISVIYYLRLARAPFTDSEAEAPARTSLAPTLRTALLVCGVAVLVVAFVSTPLFNTMGLATPDVNVVRR